QALAADVEHWLADEPVSAYREPLPARLTRWGRRHRPLVAGAAALGVALALTALALAWQSERARQQLAGEQAATEQARQQAEVNEKHARESVRKYFITTTEHPDWQAVGVERLRKDLLLEARRYFQEFVAARGQDAALLEQLADAHFRL